MTDIAIVDYGMGNLRSVSKALEHVAPTASICVTSDPEVVRSASRVVVPGQGAMPDCLRELDKLGLRRQCVDAALHKPFLGICLGLQMLFDSSEEGNVKGLGIVTWQGAAFLRSRRRRANVEQKSSKYRTWAGIKYTRRPRIPCGRTSLRMRASISCTAITSKPPARNPPRHIAEYPFPFTCAVAKDNIFAVQFHPEKSQEVRLERC